jgi:xylan 1,4-beta-xylosidase
VDFVSTHHYPTDSFGRPGDDTPAQLAASPRSVLREQARVARAQVGEWPLYYTEWCTSSNPRDTLHDQPYAAAFIVKTVLEARGLVQGYSYWTFSDIFEENYFPSVPFHGGFGLLNLHGIAKPAYRAFELLHALGTELLEVTGSHPTLDCWVVRDARGVTVLLSNFALPGQPIAPHSVRVTLSGVPQVARAILRRIDEGHANPRRLWLAMGSPEYLDEAQVAALHTASGCAESAMEWDQAGTRVDLQLELPELGVASIRIDFA